MDLQNLNEEFDKGLDADSQKDKAAKKIRDLIMAAQQFIDSLAKENAKKRDDESADRDDGNHPHGNGERHRGWVLSINCGSQSNADGERIDRICNALKQDGRNGEFAFFFLLWLHDAFNAIKDHLSADDCQKPKGNKKMPGTNLIDESRAQKIASKGKEALQSSVDEGNENGLPNFEAFVYQPVGN